jgi:hypothetical protein
MRLNLMRRTAVRAMLWHCGLLNPQTQTSAAERVAIARHAAGGRRLVEIGVFNGVTTLEMRKTMDCRGVLWAVDPFPPGRLGFCLDEHISRHTAGRSANGTVIFVLLTGAEAAARYAEERNPPVEFIFIDGDHSWAGIDADWKAWSPLVGLGGIVALHDSRPCSGKRVPQDSIRYTEEVIRRDPRFTVIDEVESLTVLRAEASQSAIG